MLMHKIKRARQLFSNQFFEFIQRCRCYSIDYATYGFLWWCCFYIQTSIGGRISKYVLLRKTRWLDRHIEKKYSGIIESFKNNPPQPHPVTEYKIWVFWGQGEEAMPPLILACYRQLTRFHSNVTLITIGNVGNYIELSSIIYEKVKEGRISWANFSDIVRTTLIARYGGLWLDATVWIPGPLPLERLETLPFFSANGGNGNASCHAKVYFWTTLKWNWSSWCLWSNMHEHLLFSFVSRMLQTILEHEKIIPDYVLMDYLIYYACKNFPSVRQDMEGSTVLPCPHRNDLAAIMNLPYDEERYRQLIKEDSVFKLSFKTAWERESADGLQTFYGKLLSADPDFPERDGRQ